MHISLDDFILAFQDLTNNEDNYLSIFDNETFNYLKNLHDKYSVVVSCYCYYETDDKKFDLSQCTDKFSNEFKENSSWLKFGFHDYQGNKNYENANQEETKNDYDIVINELLRITGSEECIDKVVRLQNFAGSEEALSAMENTHNGIVGVLGADDKRRSYNLDDNENSYLYKYDFFEKDNLDYFRTDLRLENIDNIDEALKNITTSSECDDKRDILIIFTHEWQLPNDGIKSKLEKCCQYSKDNGYVFDYPMNRINKENNN
ncbi:MAG: hypothetical protein PUE01_11610 [Clostridiaceae bacterium]|nr:hypothetical protein [Clostridiaceae bacterium]